MAFVSDDKLAARYVPEFEEARTAEQGYGLISRVSGGRNLNADHDGQ
jgi:hypothetical protein